VVSSNSAASPSCATASAYCASSRSPERANAHAGQHAEILRFFDGFDLVDPGLVYIPQWRPDSPADVPSDPSKFWDLVGVARKP
jgi:hypothetical protein